MSDRLTLATSTGLPYLALVFHVGMGLVALAAGSLAIAVRKGGTLHRRSGVVFAVTMIATGLTAIVVDLVQGEAGSTAGALTAYLVFTAYTTVRPLPGAGQRVDLALMAFASLIATWTYAGAFVALGRPGNHIDGVPAGMFFFLGTIVLLAAIGDLRVIRAGGIEGARRLARHLWRMCFGLFIATGSFVTQLAMMDFLPAWSRSVPVILAMSAGPLVVLLYFMWRVRLRQNLRGLITTQPR